ncbi:unnamed protein product [Rotaria sp. Silwood2]|nr:unnamed protein product [Rotaria sp. Silwood2]CAF3972885.1 unnamed protein product [Rotaria sp. Silwood2]
MSSTGQCFDIGNATSQSLREFERRQQSLAIKYQIPLDQLDSLADPDLLAKFDPNCSETGVAGNGALMRLAPVPLFFYRYPAEAVEFSGISGKITHGDQKAYDACRYYGALIVAALRGETKTQLLDGNFYLNHKSWFNNKPLTQEVMNVAQGSYKKPGGYRDGIRGKGYIVNALEAALWAFCYDENSFEKGVLDAVNLGDDTDTTAAIYGQLAGAYYGYEKLPQKWVTRVYASNFITCLSKWIVYEGELWQPKLPISSGSGSNHQFHSNVVLPTTAALSSVSETRPTHIQASTPTFKESSSREWGVNKPMRFPEERPSSTYGTALAAQSNVGSRSRTTEALFDHSGGTEPTTGGVLRSSYNFVTPYGYDNAPRSVDGGMPFSYGSVTGYGYSGRTGFSPSGTMPSAYGGAAGSPCVYYVPYQQPRPNAYNGSFYQAN